MIKIIKDVDIIEHVKEYDTTLVSANLYATMGGGVQYDVKQYYPYVYLANLQTKYGDKTRMGSILECSETDKPNFCLCYIFEKINTRPDIIKENVSYESLEKCLKLVNVLYKGKTIASTLLGSSKFDGNGDKTKILDIFTNTLTDVNVDLYDFEEDSKYVKEVKAYKKYKTMEDGEEKKEFLKKSRERFSNKIKKDENNFKFKS